MTTATLPAPPATAPSRADQDNPAFSANVDAFLAWVTSLFTALPDWLAEIEQLAAGVYAGTSTTSIAIGTGAKSFTASTGRGWIGGQTIRVTDHANSSNFMLGTVTSYDAATGALVVNVASVGGSGTHAAWDIGLEISTDLSAYLLKAGGTMTGLLTLIAAASGQESLVIPHGAAPSSPTNGSVWTTTAGLFAQINGATIQLLPFSGGTLTGLLTLLGYTETVVAPAAGSSFSPDLSTGSLFRFITNANATLNLPTPVAGKSFITVIAYGGTHTLAFAGGARKWPNGAAPTATSASGKLDVYSWACLDGTNWLGSQIANLS